MCFRIISPSSYVYCVLVVVYNKVFVCNKVFLHPKKELPQVRDLGFAIAPGVHALIAIRLNEVCIHLSAYMYADHS